MRLKRLELTGKYKSIKGTHENPFTYDFKLLGESYSPLCLVGLNGSGKSNFIELIADIFGYADRYFNDQFECAKNLTYDFELNYLLNVKAVEHQVIMIGKQSRIEMFIVKYESEMNYVVSDHHNWLPSNIIAYSSGHNQGLSSVFAKTQYQYYEVLRKQSAFYRGFQNRYEVISGREERLEEELSDYVHRSYFKAPSLFSIPSRVRDIKSYIDDLDLGEPLTAQEVKQPISIFTDHSFSQLIFIYLSISKNEAFSRFIHDKVNIKKLYSFELDLRLSSYKDFEIVKNIVHRLMSLSAASQGLSSKENLTSFNKNTLSGLLNFTLNEEFYEAFDSLYLDSPIFLEHLITLAHLVAKRWSSDEKKSLKTSKYEGNVPNVSGGLAPLRFINTQVKLRKPSVATSYDRLSDGEHQLMQVIGSLIMFDNEQSLFILDEPESHFNPEWRMEFIEIISKYVNLRNVDVMISTHSPFLLSACKSERVLHFEKDDSGNVAIKPTDRVETYGASFDSLLTSVFDLNVLISKKPLSEIEAILDKHKQGVISDGQALTELESYGDSFELNYRRNQLRQKLSTQESGNE